MEKLDIVLISLAVIFIFMLGFVANNLYFNDKGESLNKISNPSDERQTNTQSAKNTTQSISLGTDLNSCINNTKDNPQCKDCCDCLSGVDSSTRTACRDTCAVHDFSKNINLITISVPSVFGKEGDYSECVAKGATECKTCCENQIGLVCGDYQYCRTACNNAFGDAKHNITATAP